MRKFLVLVVLAAAACQGGDPEVRLDEVDLESDGSEKADTLGKRALVPILTKEGFAPSQEYDASFTVPEAPTSSRVTVKGELVVYRIPAGKNTLAIDIEPQSLFAITTYRFVLYSKLPTETTWKRISIPVELTQVNGFKRTINVGYFESIVIDKLLGKMDFVGNDSGQRASLTAELKVFKTDVDYAVFAFPLSELGGDFGGTYNYTLNSGCNGELCATK